MDNITVNKLKTLAKQRGIKGYHKLRKAELIQKLEAHPDVNEQVLIPLLEIPRNTTTSVNTIAILDDPILDDKTPVLQPAPNFIAKSIHKIKDFDTWLLDYIPPKPTFNSNESLASHHEYCKSYEAIQIELPTEGSKILFKNHNRSMRVPFIVYADFESFTQQLLTCQPNPEKSYTKQYQKHIPSGFCYHIKCFDDTLYS